MAIVVGGLGEKLEIVGHPEIGQAEVNLYNAYGDKCSLSLTRKPASFILALARALAAPSDREDQFFEFQGVSYAGRIGAHWAEDVVTIAFANRVGKGFGVLVHIQNLADVRSLLENLEQLPDVPEPKPTD